MSFRDSKGPSALGRRVHPKPSTRSVQLIFIEAVDQQVQREEYVEEPEPENPQTLNGKSKY